MSNEIKIQAQLCHVHYMCRWYALTRSQRTTNGNQLLNCVSDAGLILTAENMCTAEITTATFLHRYPRQYAERQLPKTLASHGEGHDRERMNYETLAWKTFVFSNTMIPSR